ncbi:MAG TPA: hypothetical protein VJ327_01665 [Patescibacteria group bacterium]|nr:hypothetical protein [Patescibacteria group bacterium]
MAFLPLSLTIEIVFLVIALILTEYHMVGRVIAVGCFLFEIGLFTADQVYIIESEGVITTATVALPAPVLATVTFVMVLMTYFALANFFEYIGRDMFGRKP